MKLKMLILLFASSLLGMAAPGFKIKPESKRMMIGEQINLTLTATVHKNDRVQWPSMPDNVMYGMLLGRSGVDTTQNGDELLLKEEWILTSFDSGFAVVPPVQLLVNNTSYESEPILIQVDLTETGDEYRELADPIGLQMPTWKIVLIVLASLAGATLLFILGRWLWLRQKARNTIDSRTPIQRATDQITFLLSGQVSELSIAEGTRTLYHFVAEQYAINTAVLSPAQWPEALNASPQYNGNDEQLKQLLNKANEMRFSGKGSSSEDIEAWLKNMLLWIESSTVIVEPEIEQSELV